MENKALPPLPIVELKKLLADCFPPNPWIYWADLLASSAIAWAAFYCTEVAPTLSGTELAFFTVSVFAFYRAALFIHELTHQERRILPGFSWAWNLLIGIPMLLPSFLYRGVHLDHHRRNSYATLDDGEYLPFGASPIWRTFLYLGQSVLLPFLMWFRFVVLTPLSLLHPRLRAFVLTHCSAMAIRMDTARRIPSGEDLRNLYILETVCFGWAASMLLLLSTGFISLGTVRHFYLLQVAIFLVNSIRTVVAHRYRNAAGRELTFNEQLLDSVNVEGPNLLMELVGPVGLRYHATHHLFPSMPYHNLGIAHRRLKEFFPPGSVYHQATEPTLWSAFQAHWRNTHSLPEEADKTVPGSFHV